MRFIREKSEVDVIALQAGFECIDFQTNIGMASYRKGDVRINVYLTTLTVATALNHPKKGKTQLFRKNLNFVELRELFNNPRKHTGKGYYKKSK